MQRHSGGGSRGPCLHPPRPSGESRGTDCGDGLLCAARSRRIGWPGRGGCGRGQQPQGAGPRDRVRLGARTRGRGQVWPGSNVRTGSHSIFAGRQGHASIWADDRFAHSFLEEAQLVPGTQTRPNLKIQEGCGNRCTFCVIPQTRGSSRSLAAAAVLRQVERFVAAGGKELVLSGINLGRWGRDLLSPRTAIQGLRWRGWSGTSFARRNFPGCG